MESSNVHLDIANVSSSFLSELYFLITTFLEITPCTETVETLKRELSVYGLVPPRYDWQGVAHNRTYKDLECQLRGLQPRDHLLRLCQRLSEISKLPSLLSKTTYNCHHRDNALSAFLIRDLGLARSVQRSYRWFPRLAHRLRFLRRTLGHLSAVYCLIFDRSGEFVFTGADDLLVKCWSVRNGRLYRVFRGAMTEICDLAVSYDNRLIAAGSCDKFVQVWSLFDGSPVAVLHRLTGIVTAVKFCPFVFEDDSYHYLAITSGDGTVAFWGYSYVSDTDTAAVAKCQVVFDDNPTRFHEKMRPGHCKILCATFSPGGVFFCVGSADNHVRIYQMNAVGGPQKLLEEQAHTANVDSIQWCNGTQIRFVSGSSDGTARIWSCEQQKWFSVVLKMNDETPSVDIPAQPSPDQVQPRTLRQQRLASVQQKRNTTRNEHFQAPVERRRVTMVAWSTDDVYVLTAVSDCTLRVWDSIHAIEVAKLCGHEGEIYVLEPHPLSASLLLSAAHDGFLLVWNLVSINASPSPANNVLSLSPVFRHQNKVDQGFAAIYDAKWNPDGGNTISASDSHGHVLFFGFVAADTCYDALPEELFFHTDYRPLVRDAFQSVLDEQTRIPPHKLPPPLLVDADGTPYLAYLQRFVPGRENLPFLQLMAPGPVAGNTFDDNISSGNSSSSSGHPEHRLDRSFDDNRHEINAANIMAYSPKTSALVRRLLNETEGSVQLESTFMNVVCQLKPMTHTEPVLIDKIPTVRSSRPESSNLESEGSSNEGDGTAAENETSDCTLDESDFEISMSSSSDSGSHEATLSDPQSENRNKRKTRGRHKRQIPMLTPVVLEDYTPSSWLSESFPRKSPYFPQIGDIVYYFRRGHLRYLENMTLCCKNVNVHELAESSSRLATDLDVCLVKITRMRFEINPPRLCVLRLCVLNDEAEGSEVFTIKYHDMNDVVDFLVLKSLIDSCQEVSWAKGDRIRCMIDNCWWKGTVSKVLETSAPLSATFLSVHCVWDNGDRELLSPWDLELLPFEIDSNLKDGSSVSTAEHLLFSNLYPSLESEWNGSDRQCECERISACLEAMMELSIAEPFNYPVDLTAYPEYMFEVEYPMDLSLIKTRVDNHFYRRISSLVYDLRYLAINAVKFNRPRSGIVKNAFMLTQIGITLATDPNKLRSDVNILYHDVADNFNWTQTELYDDDDHNDGGNSEIGYRARDSVNPQSWKIDCNKLLKAMMNNPLSMPFREPVSERDNPEYYRLIITPMDLSSVREDLLIDHYNSPLDFQKDIVTIFKNSMAYNTTSGSTVRLMTIKLESWFTPKMKKIIKKWRKASHRLIMIKKKHKMKNKGAEPRPKRLRLNSSSERRRCLRPGTSSSSVSKDSLCMRTSRRRPVKVPIRYLSSDGSDTTQKTLHSRRAQRNKRSSQSRVMPQRNGVSTSESDDSSVETPIRTSPQLDQDSSEDSCSDKNRSIPSSRFPRAAKTKHLNEEGLNNRTRRQRKRRISSSSHNSSD